MSNEINILPEGWQKTTLEHLITRISNGVNVTQHEERIGLPITRIETIWNGTIDLNRVKYIKEVNDELRLNYGLMNGDILFSHINSDSHLGKTAIFQSQVKCLIHGINLLLIRPSAEISSEYLNYHFQLLRQNGEFVAVAQRAVNQSSINQRQLKAFEFVLPPFNEQRRIVAKIEELFSELDKGVESLKTARAQIDVYRQAVLKHAFEGKLTARWREENKDKLEKPEQLLARIKQERAARYDRQLQEWKAAVKEWEAKDQLGKKPPKPASLMASVPIAQSELIGLPNIPQLWQYVRLSEIADIGSGMSVSKSRKLGVPIEIPYLSVANVQRGVLDLSTVKIMKIESSQLPRLALKRWDVLFNEGGDRDKLGRGWVWESKIEPCITQNHVFRASPFLESHQHSKWISHWGNTFGQLYFEAQGKQTTNLASINKTVLSRFPVPLPPIEEQEEMIQRLENQTAIIDRLEQNVASSLEKLNALRQSILKTAFAGQLVAQDPSDEPASVLLDRIRAEREKTVKNKTPKKKNKGKAAA